MNLFSIKLEHINQYISKMSTSIGGLYYYPNIINEESEKNLIQWIDSKEWDTTLKRKTQHYGYRYDYFKSNASIKDNKATPIISTLLHVTNFLIDNKFLPAKSADDVQCIINNYEKGQGISPHTDAKIFGDTIISISLLSECTMSFTHPTKITQSLTLAPRSLLLMQGEARHQWKHSIPSCKERRVSLTFRTI
jgi:alkylated DNA repair dioxygenase AlkB